MATTMRALGAILVVAGGVLSTRSALLLSGRGRPRRGPRPAFVIAGPYRRIRNPIAGGLLLVLAGIAFATRSATLTFLTALAAVAAHAWIIRVEEPRLAARFAGRDMQPARSTPRQISGSPRPEL